jgi:hypothetical protein
LEFWSTAITCFPAPIPKSISVALGDREMMRAGALTAACAATGTTAIAMAMIVGSATKLFFIKKLPQALREETLGLYMVTQR